MKELIKKLEIEQAVCANRESDQIVRFMNDKDLSRRFFEEYKNGNVWGVYYNESDELTCELKDGSTFEIIPDDVLTYDIVFNDETDSNNVGGSWSLQEAKDYIEINNGTDNGYFADYKGGTVSIYCRETDEEVYCENVK